jgi:hypothetical protein
MLHYLGGGALTIFSVATVARFTSKLRTKQAAKRDW